MPKDPSPLLGYNNNIRHKNRVFHVQTEDSGVKHPHIITHLFMDGGRILKSVKTSYSEHVGAEKMQDVVRQMMKEQHKAMLIALRDGQFDHLLDPEAGKPAAPALKPPSQAPPSEAQAIALARRKESVARAATLPHLGSPVAAKSPSVPAPRSPDPTIPDEEAPPTTRNRASARPPAPREELTLDIDALERAAAATASSAFEPSTDLPPPPANVAREKGQAAGGSYRAVTPIPPERVGPPSRPPPPPSRPAPRPASSRPPAAAARTPSSSRPPRRAPEPPSSPRVDPRAEPASKSGRAPAPSSRGSEGRYAPARPAAIFGQARPKRGNSIFGEDLISDKSLDEVILSYLAEDLESPSEKKRNK